MAMPFPFLSASGDLGARWAPGQPEMAQDPGQNQENQSTDGQEPELEADDLVHLLHQGQAGAADGHVTLCVTGGGSKRGNGEKPLHAVQILPCHHDGSRALGGTWEALPGEGSHQTCPCTAETHTLDVTLPDGSHDVREITIYVTGSCVSPTPDNQGPPAPTSLTPSDGVVLSCRGTVTLTWNAVTDPSGVAGYYVRVERQVTRGTWELVNTWGPLTRTRTNVPVSCGLGYRWIVRARSPAAI